MIKSGIERDRVNIPTLELKIAKKKSAEHRD
jgi:hypothetical protein